MAARRLAAACAGLLGLLATPAHAGCFGGEVDPVRGAAYRNYEHHLPSHDDRGTRVRRLDATVSPTASDLQLTIATTPLVDDVVPASDVRVEIHARGSGQRTSTALRPDRDVPVNADRMKRLIVHLPLSRAAVAPVVGRRITGIVLVVQDQSWSIPFNAQGAATLRYVLQCVSEVGP